MQEHPWSVRMGAGIIAVVCSVSFAAAQAPESGAAREAAEAYLAYTRVVETATKLDEVLVHLSQDARAMLGGPGEQEGADEVLEMLRAFMPREIVIVGSTAQDGGVELSATGTDEGAPATGVIAMVREGGTWKVRREQWQVRERVN